MSSSLVQVFEQMFWILSCTCNILSISGYNNLVSVFAGNVILSFELLLLWLSFIQGRRRQQTTAFYPAIIQPRSKQSQKLTQPVGIYKLKKQEKLHVLHKCSTFSTRHRARYSTIILNFSKALTFFSVVHLFFFFVTFEICSVFQNYSKHILSRNEKTLWDPKRNVPFVTYH